MIDQAQHLAPGTGVAAPPPTARYVRLMTLLMLPSIAMYAVFQGAQQILIPAQMDALDPANKVTNLGLLTTLSAISAVLALPLGGAVSDRTAGRWGRRAPWLVIMAALSAGLMVLMGQTSALVPFALVYTVLWFTMNFYQGALTAVLPDRVPIEHRGVASALIGLSVPVGILLGVNLAARTDSSTSYAAFALILIVCTAGFVLFAREPAYARPAHAGLISGAPRIRLKQRFLRFFASFTSRDFTLAFLSRALLFVAYFSVSGYIFYFLQDTIGERNLPQGSAKIAVSILSTVNMLAWILTILVAGWLADRWSRHKLFVGISAVGLGVSMLVPILVPTWYGIIAYSVLNGVFFGTYMAIDLALMSFVLPEKEAAGRDMGILAVATAAPQLVSPAIAGSLILLAGYDALFLFGAVVALGAGVCAFFIRGVR